MSSSNPPPINLPYPVYKYPNYKIEGKNFESSKDGYGFSNFSVANHPDPINFASDPVQEQVTLKNNPMSFLDFKRHNAFLYRDHYQDQKIIEDETVPEDYIYLDIVKTIHERNPLIDAFFSEYNVKFLQELLAKMVNAFSDGLYTITPESQRKNELLTIMRAQYLQVPVDHYGSIKNEICKLNRSVLEWAVPSVIIHIQSYLGFVRDNSQTHTMIDRPLHMSMAGTKMTDSASTLFV